MILSYFKKLRKEGVFQLHFTLTFIFFYYFKNKFIKNVLKFKSNYFVKNNTS